MTPDTNTRASNHFSEVEQCTTALKSTGYYLRERSQSARVVLGNAQLGIQVWLARLRRVAVGHSASAKDETDLRRHNSGGSEHPVSRSQYSLGRFGK
jgi:hypothetical protein